MIALYDHTLIGSEMVRAQIKVTLKGALFHAGMGSQLLPCDGLTEASQSEIRNVWSWLIANRAFKTHIR